MGADELLPRMGVEDVMAHVVERGDIGSAVREVVACNGLTLDLDWSEGGRASRGCYVVSLTVPEWEVTAVGEASNPEIACGKACREMCKNLRREVERRQASSHVRGQRKHLQFICEKLGLHPVEWDANVLRVGSVRNKEHSQTYGTPAESRFSVFEVESVGYGTDSEEALDDAAWVCQSTWDALHVM